MRPIKAAFRRVFQKNRSLIPIIPMDYINDLKLMENNGEDSRHTLFSRNLMMTIKYTAFGVCTKDVWNSTALLSMEIHNRNPLVTLEVVAGLISIEGDGNMHPTTNVIHIPSRFSIYLMQSLRPIQSLILDKARLLFRIFNGENGDDTVHGAMVFSDNNGYYPKPYRFLADPSDKYSCSKYGHVEYPKIVKCCDMDKLLDPLRKFGE